MPIESIPRFDLYAELGLATSADRDEIETAFRMLAKRHHPDKADDQALATTRMVRLNIARAWLVDVDRRARYDEIRGVRSGPPVELPPIDPLGDWPADTHGPVGREARCPAPAPTDSGPRSP